MSNITLVTPYFSLPFGQKSPKVELRTLKSIGFDGIEAFLVGKLIDRNEILKLREEASREELLVRFHQGWSWGTGQRIKINYILRALGALTPEGQSLIDQFQNVGSDPVVVYANHLHQEVDVPDNYVFQTVSEFRDGRDYAWRTSDTDFLKLVQRRKGKLVLDTQHYLEWMLNAPFVNMLPVNGRQVTDMVIEAWQTYSPYVAEIHLCDFDPKLGPQEGRNVFPGTGIFDVRAFADVVKRSKWSGVVSPEVKPQHIKTEAEMGRLATFVHDLFS